MHHLCVVIATEHVVTGQCPVVKARDISAEQLRLVQTRATKRFVRQFLPRFITPTHSDRRNLCGENLSPRHCMCADEVIDMKLDALSHDNLDLISNFYADDGVIEN